MGFKQGHKYGKGRPPVDPEMKEIKAVNRALVEGKLALFMTMSIDKLEAIAKDRTKPTLDHMLASIVARAIAHGDPKHLDFLLDRTIGKVKDVQEVDVTHRRIEEVHMKLVDELPRAEIIKLARLKSGDAGE